MASCITFNTLQQISHSLSKHPSSLSSSFLSFQCLPLFLNSSPPKHTTFSVVKQHAIATASCTDMPKLSTTDPERMTKRMNPRVRKENGSGFSPLRSGGERVERQHGRHLVSSVVEEKAEKRFTKDKYRRKDKGFRKRREMDSGNSSFSSEEGKGNEKFLSLKSVDSHVVNGKMEKKAKKGGDNHAKEEKEKGPKKDKAEAPQIQLRAELDMCSKRGDVMGAIQLYDWAQKEGIKMGQYHYAVLLYLCSSAAIGVVQPAKSGTVSRTSSPASEVSLMELSELGDRGDSNASATDYATRVSSNRLQLINTGRSSESTNKLDSSSDSRHDNLDSTLVEQFPNGFGMMDSQHLNGSSFPKKNVIGDHEDHEIQVSEDGKMYALQRGFEIYENMCMENIPMNEATSTAVARMALAMGDGDLAFGMVKQMKPLGINPKLRSYAPALSAYCSSGDADKAFAVEKHMLEHGVCPEEAELEALLRVSTEAGKGDKVYYLLHKLRTTVRKVSPSTAGAIGRWFKSKAATRVGKTKWDEQFIKEVIENRGGGWHGQGWLGKGKWTISCASVGSDAVCRCCGEKLALIDLDPVETENFAESVASIAIKRDKDSTFQKFQQWLDYYGPFEAVVDGANVGLFSQSRFMPSKINAIANAIRQKLPSKKLPLIVLHNKRITGRRMDEPVNKALIERWRNADVLYATPTGSNDDWYWLYAAIKFKCLVVTNDKMRDHKFQLLGNDFFPRWKERHQVHFSFADTGPVFYMPPPCSVVIQESEKGHWHIPVETEDSYEAERAWLCIRHANASVARHNSISNRPEEPQSVPQRVDRLQSTKRTGVNIRAEPLKHRNHENGQNPAREVYKNLRTILSASGFQDHRPLLSQIEAAEELGDCVIDFQI